MQKSLKSSISGVSIKSAKIADSDGTLHEYEGNESYVYGTWRIEEHSFIVSDEGEDEGSSYIILLTDKKLRMTSYPDEGYAEFRKVK